MSKTGYAMNLALRDQTDMDKCCAERSEARGKRHSPLALDVFPYGFLWSFPGAPLDQQSKCVTGLRRGRKMARRYERG